MTWTGVVEVEGKGTRSGDMTENRGGELNVGVKEWEAARLTLDVWD